MRKIYVLGSEGFTQKVSQLAQQCNKDICPFIVPSVARIMALTSMSPKNNNFLIQKESVKSWLDAGCEVYSFQSPEEISLFNRDEWIGVNFIPTNSSKQFPSYIPISNMMQWAGTQEGCALVINADCKLCVSAGIMRSFVKDAENGLVYFIRHDVDESGNVARQTSGIDAFMFSTKNYQLVPTSDILCMGKPWWDTVLPVVMLRANKVLSSPSFPVLLHKKHDLQWSLGEDFNICQKETTRLIGWNKNDKNDQLMFNCRSGGELHNRICGKTQAINHDPIWFKIV